MKKLVLALTMLAFPALLITSTSLNAAEVASPVVTLLTEVSGVWSSNIGNYTFLTTINLDGKTKTISAGLDTYSVTIKNYDNEKKIITLTVNKANDPAEIWIIRQVAHKDGFTLNLTFENGKQMDLSFVRNLN